MSLLKISTSTLRVRLSLPIKLLSFCLAFLIFVFSFLMPAHEVYAVSSSGQYIIFPSVDPVSFFNFSPTSSVNNDFVFLYFSDFDFSSPLLAANPASGPGYLMDTSSVANQYPSDFLSDNTIFFRSDSTYWVGSSRLVFKNPLFNSSQVVDSTYYTFNFSVVLPYNLNRDGYASFVTTDLLSLNFGQRRSDIFNYDFFETFSPSSVYSVGTYFFADSSHTLYCAQFNFSISGSSLSDLEYMIFDIRHDSPDLSWRTNSLFFSFLKSSPNYVRLSNPDLDSAELQADVISDSIANIGSGTPPVNFSGSQSSLGNLNDQLSSFDDTYKVDTSQVDQNFQDSLDFLDDGNLASGFGVVGDLIDRFNADNPIWFSCLMFALCFGLALFAIGRGVSIGDRRAAVRAREARYQRRRSGGS